MNDLAGLPRIELSSCRRDPAAPEIHAAHVTLDGNVSRAWIRAKGHLIILGECEDSRVESECGSVFLLYGSMKKSTVKAGVNLYVKHALDAELEAARDVIIENSVINSSIRAGERIISEQREGRIMGGRSEAGTCIDIFAIGSVADTPTEVVIRNADGCFFTEEIHPKVTLTIGAASRTTDKPYLGLGLMRVHAEKKMVLVSQGRRVEDGAGGLKFVAQKTTPMGQLLR